MSSSILIDTISQQAVEPGNELTMRFSPDGTICCSHGRESVVVGFGFFESRRDDRNGRQRWLVASLQDRLNCK